MERTVEPGDMFHKAGRPGIVWTVDRLKPNLRISHVVLVRADDPTTKITVSAETLANPLYFRRPAAARDATRMNMSPARQSPAGERP